MEKVAENFTHHPFLHFTLVSTLRYPVLRVWDTLISVMFRRYMVAHLDLFSGRSFYLSSLTGKLLYWRKKPFIITLRGGRLTEFYLEHTKRMDKLLRQAGRIQTPSRFLQAFFQEKGFEVAYLPNPVQLNLFTPPKPNAVRRPFSLLWVRAFDKIYHPELPVQILNALLKDYPEASLTMIGPDKGLLTAVQQQITNLDLQQRVHIKGSVPNEQLPQYYQSHAVFLNTTEYESFGVAVLEAAACGIPIVSSAVGEIPQLWQHETDILLTDSITVQPFTNAVKKLFDQPETALLQAKNARKKAEAFDFQRISQTWEKVFLSLISPPST